MCVWGWRARDVCLGMGFANIPRPGLGVLDLLVDDWAGVAVKAALLMGGLACSSLCLLLGKTMSL